MQSYIVEFEFKQPYGDNQHDADAKKLDPCLKQYGVAWQRSYLAADRLKMICEFQAASAEEVRNALRSADTPFARVWQALKYTL